VGTPMANRGMEEIERLIGFFANTVTLRSKLDRTASFDAYAKQLRNIVFEANDNQELPFDRVVEELNPQRIAGHALFFDTMFLVERHGQANFRLPELEIEPFAGDRVRGGILDLTMTIFERRDGSMEIGLSYSPELFHTATAERQVEHYYTILSRTAERPSRPLYEIAAVPAEQRDIVMTTWNARRTEWPETLLPHQLITRQAKLTPKHVAVRSEGASMTYEELDALSSRLAHELRSRGIGRNRTVGLYM